jgi:hypothetical protein
MEGKKLSILVSEKLFYADIRKLHHAWQLGLFSLGLEGKERFKIIEAETLLIYMFSGWILKFLQTNFKD